MAISESCTVGFCVHLEGIGLGSGISDIDREGMNWTSYCSAVYIRSLCLISKAAFFVQIHSYTFIDIWI